MGNIIPTPFVKQLTLGVSKNSQYGSYLVDGAGRSVYMSTSDSKGVSNCSGTCLLQWIPVVSSLKPNVVPNSGVNMNLISSLSRPGLHHELQVSYGGYPLYYNIMDLKPGDTNGQGSNGHYLLDLTGNPITGTSGSTNPPSNSGSTNPPSNSGSTNPPSNSGSTNPPSNSGTSTTLQNALLAGYNYDPVTSLTIKNGVLVDDQGRVIYGTTNIAVLLELKQQSQDWAGVVTNTQDVTGPVQKLVGYQDINDPNYNYAVTYNSNFLGVYTGSGTPPKIAGLTPLDQNGNPVQNYLWYEMDGDGIGYGDYLLFKDSGDRSQLRSFCKFREWYGYCKKHNRDWRDHSKYKRWTRHLKVKDMEVTPKDFKCWCRWKKFKTM